MCVSCIVSAQGGKPGATSGAYSIAQDQKLKINVSTQGAAASAEIEFGALY